MDLDHIGYVVKNIDSAKEAFGVLGYCFGPPIIDEKRKISICFGNNDKERIELVEPLNCDSSTWNLLAKTGASPYHLCFSTKDMESDIAQLRSRGYLLIEEPDEAIAFDNCRVAFLYNKNIGLIELVEKSKVTICCITYNHEKYIRKCLDGFLMQKTKFPYDILIHDDCSTDGTIEILKEYESKYSNIKVLYETENQFSKGVKIAFDILLPLINTKYVAICEGDDYWTDIKKLEKQLSFMEKNQDCVMTVHNGIKENTKDGKATIINPFSESKYLETEEMFMAFINNPPTASFVLRMDVLKDYPLFVRNAPVVDDVLRLFYFSKGKVYYFDDCMCSRHINHEWSWNSFLDRDEAMYEKYVREILLFYDYYNEYTQGKYQGYVEVVKRKIKNRFTHITGKDL